MASYYVKKIKKSKKLKSLVYEAHIYMYFPCRCQSQSLDFVFELRCILFEVTSVELCSDLLDCEHVPGCI